MIALEQEATLRVGPGARVDIGCVSGAVWVTQENHPRDLFLIAGESLALSSQGLTLVTALQPATLRIAERIRPTASAAGWWRRAAQISALLNRARVAIVRV